MRKRDIYAFLCLLYCGGEPIRFSAILFKFSLLEVPHISKKEHLINEEITVPEVRLVGEDGEQLGIVSIDTAQNLSIDKGLDLGQ